MVLCVEGRLLLFTSLVICMQLGLLFFYMFSRASFFFFLFVCVSSELGNGTLDNQAAVAAADSIRLHGSMILVVNCDRYHVMSIR